VAITKIRTADGTVLRGKKLPKQLRPVAERRFDEAVTYEVTRILEQNVQMGTGTKAQIGCPAAGKTGTTDQHSDAWFVGYTPRLSTAVWVGYPDSQVRMYTEYYGGSVAGGTFPSEIWSTYMSQARGGFCGGFPAPGTSASFTPFYGTYSGGSGSTTAPSTGTTTTPPTTTTTPPTAETPPDTAEPAPEGGTDEGTTNDTGGFDPNLYESPPQEAPGN
jgi:penicillin-binding protein 1A